MWSLLDTIGAGVIGASIIFMVMSLNLQMNTVSIQITEHNLIQSSYTAAMDIIDYDFHKMGYRASGEIILEADSANLKYLVDLGDNGIIDTVHYSADTIPEDSIGNDIYLYRTVNDDDAENIGLVSDFNLSYFDSLGNKINYGDLVSASNRARIRTVEIIMELTVEEGDTTGYKDVNWRIRVQPKNLLTRI
jgi:hypothetical protein